MDFGENENDVFGFLGTDGSGENTGDYNGDSAGNSGDIFAGPNKDAVIFCVDCSKFDTISQGMSIRFWTCTHINR